MMAQFAVLTRLKEPRTPASSARCRSTTARTSRTPTRAKSYQEYRDYAGVDEGMNGISTRFAFKILSKVFNFDSTEVAANPVHLMYVLEQQIEREQFPAELETQATGFIKEYLSPRYAEFIGKEIQTAYLESYSEYGQNIFDRYVTYADYWIQDRSTATPTPARCSTATRSTPSWRRSRSRPASPTPRTSATRSSTSCCARAPTTRARTRAGPATRSCAR
jgi:predicted Ser/Thr protein kinase